jgi:hypothetical protein
MYPGGTGTITDDDTGESFDVEMEWVKIIAIFLKYKYLYQYSVIFLLIFDPSILSLNFTLRE